MKKNMLMRAASGLFVATMLTTSVVSGTFAKYVTSDSASDSARVAKWGVLVSVNGHLFDKTYYSYADGNDANGSTATVSVDSTNVNLVAPGTQTDFSYNGTSQEYTVAENASALTFSISGTPEVSVKTAYELTTSNDIFLKAGTYPDYTKDTSESLTAFTVSTNDYHPVEFTLIDNTTNKAVSGGEWITLSDMQILINKLSSTTDYAANTELDKSYTLIWRWQYENAGMDPADTLLGNLAADATTYAKAAKGTVDGTVFTSNINNESLTSGTDYSTDINLSLTITVTQID